jgi:hypothetical protein
VGSKLRSLRRNIGRFEPARGDSRGHLLCWNDLYDRALHREKHSGAPMFAALQVLTVVMVAIAMALALAHALELPGKLRLSQENYVTVQAIYYPGFTFGGVAEPLGLILLLVLLFLTPGGTPAFWTTGGAFVALLAMHAAYWLLTHPTNNFWLEDLTLNKAAAGFFTFDPLRRSKTSVRADWSLFRDRWEFSHVVRAGLGLLSLILLVIAVAM